MSPAVELRPARELVVRVRCDQCWRFLFDAKNDITEGRVILEAKCPRCNFLTKVEIRPIG